MHKGDVMAIQQTVFTSLFVAVALLGFGMV